MTDEELKDLVASLAIAQQKTDIQMAKTDIKLAEQQKKTDVQLAKTDAKIDRIAALIGNISNNQKNFAEEFFYRSLLKNAHLGDIHFDIIDRNLQRHKDNLQDEFDLVLVNGDSLTVVEIKHKAHLNLIDNMLNKKLPNFRALFPYYEKLKLYGVIASLISNNELVEKAKTAGLFFLTQQGQHVVLVNDKVKAF